MPTHLIAPCKALALASTPPQPRALTLLRPRLALSPLSLSLTLSGAARSSSSGRKNGGFRRAVSGSRGASTTYLYQGHRGQWPERLGLNTHPKSRTGPTCQGQKWTRLRVCRCPPQPQQRAPQHPARASPGCQGAAQHMFHVPIAASSEGVHAPSELPRHLWTWAPLSQPGTQDPGGQGAEQGELRLLRGRLRPPTQGGVHGAPQDFCAKSLVATVHRKERASGVHTPRPTRVLLHQNSPLPFPRVPSATIQTTSTSTGPTPIPTPILCPPLLWGPPGFTPARWWYAPE